jgi:hypothetical protein
MPIEVGPGRTVVLGQLRQHALHIGAGQRIAYVTDAAYHPANAERIIAISRNATTSMSRLHSWKRTLALRPLAVT